LECRVEAVELCGCEVRAVAFGLSDEQGIRTLLGRKTGDSPNAEEYVGRSHEDSELPAVHLLCATVDHVSVVLAIEEWRTSTAAAYQRLRGKAGTSVASSFPGGLNPDDHIRDPFVLEFLNLKDEYSESDLEQALILELERFLLELGNDFAFVARQKRLRIGTEWYRVDLLFFHPRLRSLLIVELKVGKFTHADAGQMNLYLNYARKHWVNPDENPPVGLILCSERDAAVAHYSLESLGNTVLAREYELTVPDEHRLAERLALTRNRLLSSRTERG
jgi:predicted nuclease of restriction endonuclease-like (RecB) superfamily